MPPGAYKKPPITEAVIEIRFGSAIAPDRMARFVREIKSMYPAAERNYEVNVQLGAPDKGDEPSAKVNKKLVGYKLMAKSQIDIILITADRLATLRMAPYCGWSEFLERAKDNFSILKKCAGYRSFTRCSTRYINRIDIPRDNSSKAIDLTQYVHLDPQMGHIFPTVHNFNMQVVGSVPEIGGRAIINAGIVNSPLIDHVSLLLDIDLYKDSDLPQKEPDFWDIMETIHIQKNRLFEAFLTKNARELFDRE